MKTYNSDLFMLALKRLRESCSEINGQILEKRIRILKQGEMSTISI
jgi:hypothetical protein